MDYIRNPRGHGVQNLVLSALIYWVRSVHRPRLISSVKRKALQVCVQFYLHTVAQTTHTGSETDTDASLPARRIFGNIFKEPL